MSNNPSVEQDALHGTVCVHCSVSFFAAECRKVGAFCYLKRGFCYVLASTFNFNQGKKHWQGPAEAFTPAANDLSAVLITRQCPHHPPRGCMCAHLFLRVRGCVLVLREHISVFRIFFILALLRVSQPLTLRRHSCDYGC